jgi:uncharacterized protein YkwD
MVSVRSAVVGALAAALLAGPLGPAVRAEDAGKTFTAGAPGTDTFGPNPKLTCPRSSASAALAEVLTQVAEQEKRPQAQEDGRLCAAAQVLLAAWDPGAGESPPAQVLAFVSANVGLTVPVRRVMVKTLQLTSVDAGEAQKRGAAAVEGAALAELLREPVGGTLVNYEQPRYGFAADRVRKGVYKVAVVMDDRRLELDPLPRTLAAGQGATLSGKVLPPYTNPLLAVSDEKGHPVKVDTAPGDAFKAELKCGATPGDLWVELQAQRDGKTYPVTSFAVACGKGLATSVSLEVKAWPKELPAQEKRLAEGVNAQREAAGVGRVEWDDKLAAAARTAAETYRDQLARGEAPAVDLGALLEKAGAASPLVLQSPAQARTAAEAEERFTTSPTNRQNLLNPEVNRIGVGVVPATVGGKPAVFVVEIFTKFLEKVDVDQVRANLYAEIEKRRTAAGAPAPVKDAKLEKTAQEYALALAQGGGKVSADVADDVTQAIRIAYKSIDLVEGAKPNPLDFAEPAAAAKGTAVGVGIVQGDSAVLGKNAVFVTIITGQPREAKAEPAKKGGKKK